MESQPLVSIITTFYNSGDYVHSAMKCLLQQSYKNIEFICVNDGSWDETLQHLQHYQEQDKRIQIINKENEGAAHFAKAAGQAAAKGEYCFLFDHDDEISLNTIELCLDEYKKNSDLDCVTPIVSYAQPDGIVLYAYKLDEEYSQPCLNKMVTGLYAFEHTLGTFTISILGLWKSEVFKSVSFHYHENLINADEHIWRILFLKCKKIGSCEGVYTYYQHPNSSAKKHSLRHIEIIKVDALSRQLAMKQGVYNNHAFVIENMALRNIIKAIKTLYFFKNTISKTSYLQYQAMIKEHYNLLNTRVIVQKSSTHVKGYYAFILANYSIFKVFFRFKK